MNKLILLTIFFAITCNVKNNDNNREVIDMLGRKVFIPDTVRRVIPLNESVMRLISYARCSDKVCGVEDVEYRGVAFTHIFANPEIRNLPIIGPINGGDHELIMKQNPDLIIASNMSISEADDLQKKIGVPVVIMEYGDFGANREIFYKGLQFIGNIFRCDTISNALISYIEKEICTLKHKTKNKTSQKAYLGGISYMGKHDLFSTDPCYSPFELTNVENIAAPLADKGIKSYINSTIDIEQLIVWNPPLIFIDQGGKHLVKDNFKYKDVLKKTLDAYNMKNINLLWPYYMYHINYEVMLINAWAVGKTIYPKDFEDISLRDKSDEILNAFLGKPITDSLINKWGWFSNITMEL